MVVLRSFNFTKFFKAVFLAERHLFFRRVIEIKILRFCLILLTYHMLIKDQSRDVMFSGKMGDGEKIKSSQFNIIQGINLRILVVKN